MWEREGRVWTFQNSPGATQKKLVLDIQQPMPGLGRFRSAGRGVSSGLRDEPFRFCLLHLVPAGHGRRQPDDPPAVRPAITTTGSHASRWTPNGVAIPGSEIVFVDLKSTRPSGITAAACFFIRRTDFCIWTDRRQRHRRQRPDHQQKPVLRRASALTWIAAAAPSAIRFRASRSTAGTANYFIPNDNPFVGQSNVLEEFFCLGLRSPHRMTYDPATGRIFIGDVGESAREEVDIIEPGESGLNFQWNYCEGTLGKMKSPYIGISRGPVLDYPHTDGRAVIGGYVYRGKKFAADLGGKYIFGDNVMRTIWAMDETTTPVEKNVLCVMPKGTGPNSGSDYTGLSSFGTDANGEIYFCQMSSIGGRIYTLARGGPPPPSHPVPKIAVANRRVSRPGQTCAGDRS